MVVVGEGPCFFVGRRLAGFSLVNFHHPFDLHKVSWASRLVEQKRLGEKEKGLK